jgi:SAM domain (Sterile alpha motif)
MDVPTWLKSLGLDCYEKSFRDHEIDIEVLPKLTPEDLTALGVIPIGHRRKPPLWTKLPRPSAQWRYPQARWSLRQITGEDRLRLKASGGS